MRQNTFEQVSLDGQGQSQISQNTLEDRQLGGVLLTGGASRRMGRPKATLQAGGRTLAQRAAGLLQTVCEVVVEVGPGYTSLPCVREEPPFGGPLAAVAAGAAELERQGRHTGAVVLAVDMPFVTTALLRFLAGYGKETLSAVPISAGKPQPLCARYSRHALAVARRLETQGARSMKAFLGEIDVIWINEPEWGKVAEVDAFTDLDEEKDLQLLSELAAEAVGGEYPRRSTRRAEVVTVNGPEINRRTDTLAAEEPMEIRASGPGEEPVSVAVTMRTPGHDFELAAGFLLSEGLIAPGDISSIKYCEIPKEEQQYNVVTVKLGRPFDAARLRRNFYANSSCGICGKASLDEVQVHCAPIPPGPVFNRSAILAMPSELSRRQRIFEKTGGLHAAGLFDTKGNLHGVREDVGRHNACDKLIGHALLSRKLPLSDLALFVSGRLSFEIVQKAAAAGVPLIAAVSAPSSLAVEAAGALGITLAGFVREDRFNLYSHAERVDLGS